MIPISKRDIKRAFADGVIFIEKGKEKGVEEFFLHKRVISGEKKWLISDAKGNILRRTRSDIVLKKLLGCDDHIEKAYDEWVEIFNKPKKGEI